MFSVTVKYAIRACVFLFQNYNAGRYSGVKEICKNAGTPTSYTSKILHILVKEGIVKSVKGHHGGYILAIPPEEISIKSLVIALEGPAMFTNCLLTTDGCQHEEPCALHHVFLHLLQEVDRKLSTIKMDDALFVPSAKGN